jgi:hypothetical protein
MLSLFISPSNSTRSPLSKSNSRRASEYLAKPASTAKSQFFDKFSYENYRGKSFSVQKKVPREVVRSQKYRRQHALVSNNELELVIYKEHQELKDILLRHIGQRRPPAQTERTTGGEKASSIIKLESVGDRRKRPAYSNHSAMGLFNLLEIASKAHRESLVKRNQLSPFHKAEIG